MLSFIKRSLSRQTKLNLHYVLVKARHAFDFGHRVECPVCGRKASRFAEFNGRPNAMCPSCFSLERHRVLFLYLRRQTDALRRPQQILHFAAEKCLARRLRSVHGAGYVTADSMDQFIAMIEIKPDRIMNITDIAAPAASFDLVICSHVLEHVLEDRRAMAELHRVLRPGGIALVLVPINPGATETLEDLSLNEAQRRQFYGSPHHVRYYAEPDFVRRLEGSGFRVTLEHFSDPGEIARYVLNPTEVIFRCEK